MSAVVVRPSHRELEDRKNRALAWVGLSEDALRSRAEEGSLSPDERDAWHEVDTVNFLLSTHE